MGVKTNLRLSEEKGLFLEKGEKVRKRPMSADFQDGRPDTP